MLRSGRLGTITEGARGLARLQARDELRAAVRHHNPYIRETASASLMRVAEPQDIPLFVELLKDRGLQIADGAQEYLRTVGAPAVPLVIAQVLDAPAEASLDAIELLGALGDPRAIPALAAVASETHGSPRWWALEALAAIGTPDAHALSTTSPPPAPTPTT